MKRIIAIVVCAAMLFALCSCGKKNNGSYKEVEDYKKVSAKGYTIEYDDNVFEYVKTEGFDYLILKSQKQENPTDYTLTVTKLTGKSADEVAAESEKEFDGNGCFEISTDASQTVSGALCVSALADEGETIYEAQIVPFDGGVYLIEYHYSTSLDDVAVADTIYSIVSTFKVK